MSHTLSASGVYMGEPLNVSGDLLPPEDMYEACRVMSHHVIHQGGLQWDFSRLHSMKIDPAFTRLIESYLATVLNSGETLRGWKIPETTLVFPWIIRLFPEIRYIYWMRDPRDSILGAHVTDDLAYFGVPYDHTDDLLLRRAISWQYQYEIMRQTPAPAHRLAVRFEDFVLHQEQTLHCLEEFLGFPLKKVPVRADSVGRWRTAEGKYDFDFLPRDAFYAGNTNSQKEG